MKTKYVFIFESDSSPPLDMSRCYIFDNLVDAQSFFTERKFILNTYSNDSNFSIQNMQSKIIWNGDIFQGIYY